MADTNRVFWLRVEALYVVLIAFGVERLAEGAYAAWEHMTSVLGWQSLANAVLLISLALWAARLFWSASNIQRYLHRKEGPSKTTRSKRVMSFHFPVLIGQSGIFFLVCEAYRVLISPVLSTSCSTLVPVRCANGPAATIHNFAFLVVLSLTYNAIWLASLVWPVVRRTFPEAYWITNNVAFALTISIAAVSFHFVHANAVEAILLYGFLLALNSFVDFRLTHKAYLDS